MIPTPKLFLLYRRNSRIFDRVAVVLGDLGTVGNTPSSGNCGFCGSTEIPQKDRARTELFVYDLF